MTAEILSLEETEKLSLEETERLYEEEIKKIWNEHRDMRPKEIFTKFLGKYFDTAPTSERNSKSFLFFIRMIGRWKGDERNERIKRGSESYTEEDMEKIQENSRKKMILILDEALRTYEEKSARGKDIDLAEIRKMYQTLQMIEDRTKRTELEKGKLKLDVIRTILPYHRLPADKLENIKNKVDESFSRINELKSSQGEFGGDTSDNG
jgi:CRISPR/Cas system CSM-associated protein Csm2 small subunit